MQAKKFTFTLEQKKGTARAGRFVTPHGEVQTPVFMPVGTKASVKALHMQDLDALGAQIMLGNAYHLYLRPGLEVLKEIGGIHAFNTWQKPVLTDSGGFQVFSLGLGMDAPKNQRKVKITDQGVHFKSHLDGSMHFFSPETSIEIQRTIGADIIMAFDECSPNDADDQYLDKSLERTHRWAQECYDYWVQHKRRSIYGEYQALFGIIQGGMSKQHRLLSTEVITSIDFDGIAVGGESVGYNMLGTAEIMSWIESLLPEDKPRYAMGLGRDPQNIIDAVMMGFDMFDCVGPTRLARNGALFCGSVDVDSSDKPFFNSIFSNGRLPIGSRRFKTDDRVIDAHCDCYTCSQGYSRAYLHHLYKVKELTFYSLASIHNVRVMVRTAEQMREYVVS